MDIDFSKGKISKEELRQSMEEDNIKIVEIMPESVYEKSHIKGAINIPPAKIKEIAPKVLKKEDNIVVYCKDLTCLESPYLIRWLQERGYKKVLDYEAGKADWKAAGYPMASGKNP